MFSVISYASEWGYSHGGINSFNTDLLCALGFAYPRGVQIVCVVSSATQKQIREASNANVTLVPLSKTTQNKQFSKEEAQDGIEQLGHHSVVFDPDQTIWLGHDLISGQAAIESARIAKGKSALIHHMSYDHYESYAENSSLADQKKRHQKELFDKADLALAVGPLLRDALSDLLGSSKPVYMIVPGLAEIETTPAPNTFTAFLSGRLSADTARIKQGHLGVASFATAHSHAINNKTPLTLCQNPKLILRGVSFELAINPSKPSSNPETDLKEFAYTYAKRVINLHALPYTKNRSELYSELCSSTVAMMPSWHEGFGLTGWEAISATVPLILSTNSGVYRLLEEELMGAGPALVYPIDVAGQITHPFFESNDVKQVVKHLNTIATDPKKARKQAVFLKELISKFTWPKCAKNIIEIFGWDLNKCGVADVASISQLNLANSISHNPNVDQSPLQLPDLNSNSKLTISQLLKAEEELVPFEEARQPDLDSLNAWLNDEVNPIALRLITGNGGAGKTRLALELCKLNKASNWHTGFIKNDLEVSEIPDIWIKLTKSNEHLLIVIDYAETRQLIILALLKAALESKSSKKIRILLLARDGGEWWETLPTKDKDCEDFLDGFGTSGPYYLKPLYESEIDRINGYKNSLKAFAQALMIEVPNVLPDLTSDHFKRPLYIQMSALLALLGDRQSTTQGLTRALLQHEERYWSQAVSESYTPKLKTSIEEILSLTTLAGSFQTAELAFEYWSKVTSNSINFTSFNKLFESLRSLYPNNNGIDAVRPDLLGEALVSSTLINNTSNKLLDSVLSSQADQKIRLHSLTVLARISLQNWVPEDILISSILKNLPSCCIDLINVSSETQSNLPKIVQIAFEKSTPNIKNQLLNELQEYICNESIELNDFYCSVAKYIVEYRYTKYKKNSRENNFVVGYVEALIDYSICLQKVGDFQNAIEFSSKAVHLYTDLYDSNPAEYEPHLASALSVYANNLNDFGLTKDALVSAKKSLDLRQNLVKKDQELYEGELAISLTNYGAYLSLDGNAKNAISYTSQGLEIYRRLAEKNPNRYDPDLAMSLNNYAIRLVENGNTADALSFAKQALDIRQRLAIKNPDRHGPAFATSLSNCAAHLVEEGNTKEAVQYSKQALDIREQLAKKNPSRHEEDYATSLNNYASHLSENGNYIDAIAYSKQALEIRKRLAKNNPDRYEEEYGNSLLNYASHLNENGNNKEALVNSNQAMVMFHRLATNNWDRYESQYALSMSNYSAHLSDEGKTKDALNYAKQALDIRQQLASKNPEKHEPDYATSLSNYAATLEESGNYEEAIIHSQKALEIRDRFATKNPKRYESSFAKSLCNHAGHLDKIGNIYEAIVYSEKCLKIRQRLINLNLDLHEPSYAESLNDHSKYISKNGSPKDALDYAKKSFEIHLRLADKAPEVYEKDLAMSMINYSNILNENGNTTEAISLAKKCLHIVQRLANANPELNEPLLAENLHNYAKFLLKIRDTQGALTHVIKALEIRQRLAEKSPERYKLDFSDTLDLHTTLLKNLIK